jgi:hypothetical protein
MTTSVRAEVKRFFVLSDGMLASFVRGRVSGVTALPKTAVSGVGVDGGAMMGHSLKQRQEGR